MLGYIVLGILAIVFAAGWFDCSIYSTALVYYIAKNGYRLPTENDVKACTKSVIKHWLKDLTE